MHKTWVLSLGWEDPLEKGKATHSSILAQRISWIAKSQTWLSDFHFGESKWCNAFCISTAGYTVEELRKK